MLLTFILPPGFRRHGVLQQDCAVSSVELEAHELLLVSAGRMKWRGRRRRQYCAPKIAAYVWLPDWVSAPEGAHMDLLGRILLDVPGAFNKRRLPEFPPGCNRLEWASGEWRPLNAEA